jgi:acetyl esterase/lipase
MRANAAQYNVDPNKIASMGGSAGGHLAMMVGYSADVPELEGDCGWPGVSSAVQAVVDIYGPFNIAVAEAGEKGNVRRLLGGKTFEEAEDLYKLASPSTHLKAGAPPTLILHGTLDSLVPLDQSDQLSARLKELSIPYQYEKFEGYPHVMDVVKEVNWRVQWHTLKFLKEHLGMAS